MVKPHYVTECYCGSILFSSEFDPCCTPYIWAKLIIPRTGVCITDILASAGTWFSNVMTSILCTSRFLVRPYVAVFKFQGSIYWSFGDYLWRYTVFYMDLSWGHCVKVLFGSFLLIHLCCLQNHKGEIMNHMRIEQKGNFGLWLTVHLRILWTGLVLRPKKKVYLSELFENLNAARDFFLLYTNREREAMPIKRTILHVQKYIFNENKDNWFYSSRTYFIIGDSTGQDPLIPLVHIFI